MADSITEIAQKIRPFWLRDFSSGAASVTGAGAALTAHALDGPYHSGQLSETQALWAGTKAELITHAALPDVHHAQIHDLISSNHTASGLTAGNVVRASGATTFAWAQLQHADLGGVTANQHHAQVHSITGADHTLTGSKWQLVGATADNTLGLLTPSAAPGAAEAILKSTAAGLLTLPNFTATTGVRTPMLDTASGDLTIQPAGVAKLAESKAIQSNSFTSGFAGGGWRIDDGISRTGYTTAEVDDLTVRGILRVYELLIHKIRTGNGSYLFANGGKVASVAGSGPYTLTFDEDHGLAANDLIRAQKFTGSGTYQSNCTVTSVTTTKMLVVTLTSGNAPLAGYEFVRLGNTTDADRRGGVYITADDSNAPYVDIFDGVTSFADFGSASKTKARLGKLTGITSVAGEYGLFVGTGFTNTDKYARISSYTQEVHNLPIKMYDGANVALQMDNAYGIDIRLGTNEINGISWRAAVGTGAAKASIQGLDVATGNYGLDLKSETASAGSFARTRVIANNSAVGSSFAYIEMFSGDGSISSSMNLSASLVTINGFSPWTAGNLTPGNYAALSGATFTGSVNFPNSGIWNSSGNVGIGTATPIGALHVVEATDYGITFRMHSAIGGAANTPGIFAINTASNAWRNLAIESNQLTLNGVTGGNVGIGTTSPQRKLHVAGTILVDGDEGGYAGAVGFTDVTSASVTNTMVVKGSSPANTVNAGWLKIYIGTTAAWIPYWT